MKEDKKSGMENRVILETDKINLSSGEHYLIREDKLISIPKGKWKEINEGEKYCKIFQTPSTPPDFGLSLMLRKELRYIDELLTPWNDVELSVVTNYDYLNPTDIISFILQDKEFKNWYDE